jgi:hypothetical protein
MPYDRQLFVSEMKRILKPTGQAYLSLGAHPPIGFMGQEEWEKMINGFRVEQWGNYKDYRALVSLKQE